MGNELSTWMREIIKTRVTELCQLIRSKDWPKGVPRIIGARTEPSYPEVLTALSFIPDNELETILPSECMSALRRVRRTIV